jgi:N-acetylmuramoyl-L-alanine amidase
MRDIKYIVLHCTATPHSTTVESILNYWENNLGWINPGYHFLIESDGSINNIQPIQSPSNGVYGHNRNAIHLSYIGGENKDDRTAAQKESICSIVRVMKSMFPKAEIKGHRDFPNVHKDCPQFDAIQEFENY